MICGRKKLMSVTRVSPTHLVLLARERSEPWWLMRRSTRIFVTFAKRPSGSVIINPSVRSSFPKKTKLVICVPRKSTHTTIEWKISKTMLLDNVYIAILTLTSEYRGTVTNLQTPFFTGMADWGNIRLALLSIF